MLESLFDKVAGSRDSKKRLQHGCFPVKNTKYLLPKKADFEEDLGEAASDNNPVIISFTEFDVRDILLFQTNRYFEMVQGS